MTPPLGEPLIWVQPATEVLDPLLAKGLIIDAPKGRIVLCAMDWCGIGGSTYRQFGKALADAAGAQHVALDLRASAHGALYRR